MTTITATYRIVTPMFCAGADQNSAELRLPSFKGALRFWWRSLMAGKVNGDHNELRKQEAELFGASDQKTGQSKVRLRIVNREIGEVVEPNKSLKNGDNSGLAYLGYGVMKYDGKLTRPAIKNAQFTVECRFSRRASDDQVGSVQRTLILLGTVGGLGSKSRKGYGSLQIDRLEKDGTQVQINAELEARMREIIGARNAQEPRWTAWSTNSRVVYFSTDNDAVSTLNDIGATLAAFRLWHGKGKSTFEDDHDLMFEYLSSDKTPTHPPARIAFGLPHNYFFRSLSDRGQKLNVKAEITPAKQGNIERTRRASPLFIHVASGDDTGSRIVISFLPAKYLPDPAQVQISDTTSRGKSNRQRKRPTVVRIPDPPSLWQPITRFLDELIRDPSLNAQEVTLG